MLCGATVPVEVTCKLQTITSPLSARVHASKMHKTIFNLPTIYSLRMALLSQVEVGGTRWYVHMLVRFAALFSSSKMSTLGYWNIRGVTIYL